MRSFSSRQGIVQLAPEDLFTFEVSWTTRFDEVDMQGVVHHAEIVKYLEVARVEYWRHLGLGYQSMREAGFDFMVVRVVCDYMQALRFDRTIRVLVRTSAIWRTSVAIEYLIFEGSVKPAVMASTLLVCVEMGTAKPCALPESLSERVIAFEKPGSVAVNPERPRRARLKA